MRFLPLFAAIFAMTPLAIDMYLPALPQLAKTMDASIELLQTSLSVFLAGYALGMFLFGPLADKFGRRPQLLVGLAGFSVFSFLLATTSDAPTFLVLRFLQALCGGAASVVVPGAIRELFGKDTAKGLSYVSMIMMIAPLVAPAIGGYLLLVDEWPLIFNVLGCYALFVLLSAALFFPKNVGKTPSADTVATQVNKPLSFVQSYHKVLSHPQNRVYLLVSMFAAFGFFTYLTSVSFLYMQVFGFNEQQFSGLFALNVIGLMLMNWLNARLVPHFGSQKILMFAALVAFIVALLFFSAIHFQLATFWTIAGLITLTSLMVLISANSDALVLQSLPLQSGTAAAVIGTLKFGSGALAGPLLALLFDGSGMPIAVLFCITTLLINLRIRFYLPGQTKQAVCD